MQIDFGALPDRWSGNDYALICSQNNCVVHNTCADGVWHQRIIALFPQFGWNGQSILTVPAASSFFLMIT
jgi:hypothetical protein